MESYDFVNFSLDKFADPSLNWEFQDPIDDTETTAFGALHQSDIEIQTTSQTNPVDPISTCEPLPATSPHISGVEPDRPKRISRAEWEKHRNVIEAQYPSKTLVELREYMVTEHGFIASTQQWKKKLAEWHLGKNLRPRITRFIRKRAYRRQANAMKMTRFRLRGQPIPMDKVKRHLQDMPGSPPSVTGSTPTGISYDTYRSPIPVSSRLNPFPGPPQVQLEVSRHERPTTPASSLCTSEAGPIIPAFHEGHDTDYYLTIAGAAVSDSERGDYAKAKPLFIEALEGLGVLLNPYHAQTISVLGKFTDAASRAGDLPAALDKLHRSYGAHKDLLGVGDRRTWQSLARLGIAYRGAKRINQAYHMLLNARRGILATTLGSNQETIFVSTWELSLDIVRVLGHQEDYDEAEKECLNLISQAESLGERYQAHLKQCRWELASTYLCHYRRYPTMIPLKMVENSLLEFLTSKDSYYLTAISSLIHINSLSKQNTKLQELLPLAEEFLANAHQFGISLEWKWHCQRMISAALSNVGRYDEAEYWIGCLQGEIARSPRFGPRSSWALAAHGARCHNAFRQGKWEVGKEILRMMQIIAGEILPQDHEFHTMLEVGIREGKIFEFCAICLGMVCPVCYCTKLNGYVGGE